MRRSTSSVMIMLVAVFTLTPTSAAACEEFEEPAFSRAAAHDGVIGVVERETLAANPMPWGASISVATRIWGGIRVDRWKLSDRNFVSCPYDPPMSAGAVEYDFRGAEAEWAGQRNAITRDDGLSSDESLLLDTRFGPPEAFETSGVDRMMAIVRVAGLELTLLVIGVVMAAVQLIRRRRRMRYDRHVF